MIESHSLKARLLPVAMEAFSLPLGHDLEEQLGAPGVQLHVAEAEEVESAVAGSPRQPHPGRHRL